MTTEFRHPLYYNLFVHDLRLLRHRGTEHEELSLSVRLKVASPPDFYTDRYKSVVCYDRIVRGIKSLAASGEFASLLRLGETVAVLCLEDKRVHESHVAIVPANEGKFGMGGIEICRERPEISSKNQRPVRRAANA